MSSTSPTARSLQVLRELGYEAQVVERFLKYAGPHGIRQDLFGLADIEAIAADHTLYVQACPASTLAAHAHKCLAEPRLGKLLACASRRFEVWSWALRGERGKRKLWALRRTRAHAHAGLICFLELSAEHQPADLVKPLA